MKPKRWHLWAIFGWRAVLMAAMGLNLGSAFGELFWLGTSHQINPHLWHAILNGCAVVLLFISSNRWQELFFQIKEKLEQESKED